MLFRLAITCLALTLVQGRTLACRYTVREIGFANLKGQEFALVLSWAKDGDEQQQKQSANLAEEWSQALKSKLSGSNVTVIVDQGRSPGLPANQAADAAFAENHSASTSQNGGPIRLGLVDQTGRFIASLDAVEVPPSAPRVDQWLRHNVFVPALTQMSSESLESFAHLLVIEGTDPAANQRMQDLAAKAMSAIQRLEPMLPRPIAFPLREIVVSSEQVGQQAILRQLLGNQQEAAPLLAVVYGRGRLAGPVMKDSDSTLQELLAQLALVGQSCECETDRAWLDESSLPFCWDTATRSSASSYLGFDPDSPLVRAEMLRIVSQGPKSTGGKQDSAQSDSPDAIARSLLGYSETDLNQSQVPGENSVGSSGESQRTGSAGARSVDDLGKPAGVQSTVVSGEGWDFDTAAAEPSTTEELHTENRTQRADESGSGSRDLAGDDQDLSAGRAPVAVATAQSDDILPIHVVSPSIVLAITLATVLVISLLAVFTLVIRSK